MRRLSGSGMLWLRPVRCKGRQGVAGMNQDKDQVDSKRPQPRARLLWIVIAAILLGGAVVLTLSLVGPRSISRGERPANDWDLTSPEEQDMDSGRLEAMMAYIDTHDMNVDSILIVRHGYLAFEKYGPRNSASTPHKLQSVTKSVTSLLVGIALDRGLIESLDTPVTRLLPSYSPVNLDARKEEMTLEHLLTMSDGLNWREHDYPYEDPRNIVALMNQSRDAVQFVLDRPMAYAPGEVWAYNSGASVLLGAILEEATGRNLLSFAREALFDPLGIGTIYWEETAGSHYQTGGGLSMTPRDMARLGSLMLHNGAWDGRQIVSADWVARSTHAYYPAYNCFGYGYQWWILPGGQGFQANGLYGQHIYVLPQADMVVVATASLAEDSVQQIDGLVHTFILPACTDLPQEPQRETYDAHGLTLEYPGGFCLEDGPIPGRATPSDASGIVQLRANTEPFELVLVLWHALEGGEDATDFLEAYLAGLAETGVEVTPGNSGESQQDGHAMALRYAELKIETAPVPSLTGAWICPESGRAFAATYLTAAGATPEDLLAGFQRYLAGLDCH